MWKPEEITEFFKAHPIGAKAYDLLGGTPAVLQIIFGLSVVTAVMGLFSKYPYIGMACGAIFAFYGTSAYLKYKEWWDINNIDDKLIYNGGTPQLLTHDNGTLNVVPSYLIFNTAAFDIMIEIDAERVRIGEIYAREDERRVSAPLVVSAKSPMCFTTQPICSVPAIQNITVDNNPKVITVELTMRYGRNRKSLSRRWFLKAENALPPTLSGVPTSRADSWSIIRNEAEIIIT